MRYAVFQRLVLEIESFLLKIVAPVDALRLFIAHDNKKHLSEMGIMFWCRFHLVFIVLVYCCLLIFDVIKEEEDGCKVKAIEGLLHQVAANPLPQLEPQEQQLPLLPTVAGQRNVHRTNLPRL